jgi:hypothetical protein
MKTHENPGMHYTFWTTAELQDAEQYLYDRGLTEEEYWWLVETHLYILWGTLTR